MQRVILLLSIGSFTNLTLILFSRWGSAARISQVLGLQGSGADFVSALPDNLFFGCIMGQFGALSVWVALVSKSLSLRLLWGSFLFCHVWLFYVIAAGPLEWQPIDAMRLAGRGCIWYLGTLSVIAMLTSPMIKRARHEPSGKHHSRICQFRHFTIGQLFSLTLTIGFLLGVARTIHTTNLSSQFVYDVAVGLGSGVAAVSAIYSYHLVTPWFVRAPLAAVTGICCGSVVEGPMGIDVFNLLLTSVSYGTASFLVMIAASAFDWRGCEAGASVVESNHEMAERAVSETSGLDD